MKDYYTISEISRLYGIGQDSIRYYEKIGALSPRRGSNNYRQYSLKDIYRLTIIRDLLAIGFSVKQIRDYLDCQDLEHTFTLLREEKEKVADQMARLRRIERGIENRLAHLQAYMDVEEGVVSQRFFPRRRCLRLNEDISRDEEVDYAVKKLQKKYEDRIFGIGEQNLGASLLPEEVREGRYNLFHSVFFILDEKEPGWGGADMCEEGEDGIITLPEGEYLTTFYRGGYRQSPERICALLEEARRRGCQVEGEILELYPIDNRYTVREEEFVTELQVLVKQRPSNHAV